MTIALHAPSLLIFGAIELMLLLAVSLPIWRSSGFAASGRWATFGGVLVFLALPLLALRGALPDFVTFAVANSLMLAGAQLLYQVGYALYGITPKRRWDRWVVLGGIAVLCVLGCVDSATGPAGLARYRVIATAIPLCSTAACWLVRLMRTAPRPWSLATRYLVFAATLATLIHGARAVAQAFLPAVSDPLRTPAGAVAIMGLLSSAMLTAFGFILHMEAMTRDRLNHANDALSREALTDPLTGLGNRRRLELAAIEELPRAKRHGWPMTVMLLDVDHFKRVNDQWGHAAGDTVLREVATLCRSGSRPHDVLVRWGGEEFALLLPQCDGPNAEKVARRMLFAVRSTAIAAIDNTRVAISIGIAPVNPDATSLAEALNDADAALYRAKQSGRDRYCVATDLGDAGLISAIARQA